MGILSTFIAILFFTASRSIKRNLQGKLLTIHNQDKMVIEIKSDLTYQDRFAPTRPSYQADGSHTTFKTTNQISKETSLWTYQSENEKIKLFKLNPSHLEEGNPDGSKTIIP